MERLGFTHARLRWLPDMAVSPDQAEISAASPVLFLRISLSQAERVVESGLLGFLTKPNDGLCEDRCNSKPSSIATPIGGPP